MKIKTIHRSDRLFVGLLVAQWVAAVGLGLGTMSASTSVVIAVIDLVPVVLLFTMMKRKLAAATARAEKKQAQLAKSVDRYRELVEKTACFPFELRFPKLELVYIAPQAAELLGLAVEDLEDRQLLSRVIHPDDRESFTAALRGLARRERDPDDPVDYRVVKKDGSIRYIRTLLTEQGNFIRGIAIDVTRQRTLEQELQQAQRLESVWRLAAGVAHEINTPIQYVSDSVQFLHDSLGDLLDIVDKQQAAIEANEPGTLSFARAAARAAAEAADLPYLRTELPKATARAIDGIERVATIVRSMKAFAQPSGEMKPADLDEAIANTLVIARNELRFVADVVTEYGGLPPVTCNIGEINQVILNLVLNAAHSIGAETREGRQTRGTITIRTEFADGNAVVEVTDTGGGIPRNIRSRIFEPFFTTKPVGEGTGQGLAISRAVARRHGGWITFDTELGKGTTFTLCFPAAPAGETRKAAA